MTEVTFTTERKAELLARIGRHEEAGTIAQGAYARAGDEGLLRVCAVGCAMLEPTNEQPPSYFPPQGNWHAAMEAMWGIPAWLCALEDDIFEGLPLAWMRAWPRRFVEAMPPDVDLGGLQRTLFEARAWVLPPASMLAWSARATAERSTLPRQAAWAAEADRLIEALAALGEGRRAEAS